MILRRAGVLLAAVVAAVLGACGESPPSDGPSGPRPRSPAVRPNVLLVVIDTLRSDALGCYGREGSPTPTIDALAAEGARFTQARSSSSWTLPAHASLFTGKLATSHGARYDPEGSLYLTQAIEGPQVWGEIYRVRGLSVEERTLAAVLSDAGYATAAVVARQYRAASPMRCRTVPVRRIHSIHGTGATQARGAIVQRMLDANTSSTPASASDHVGTRRSRLDAVMTHLPLFAMRSKASAVAGGTARACVALALLWAGDD